MANRKQLYDCLYDQALHLGTLIVVWKHEPELVSCLQSMHKDILALMDENDAYVLKEADDGD